jgi:hypothetical protein
MANGGTAAAAASFRIGGLTYTYPSARDANVIEGWTWLASALEASAIRVDEFVDGPKPISPVWLANTRECIRKSVRPKPSDAMADGQWLTQEIANAATDFFQSAADLLPGEPFIYSSQRGDLVAEFKAEHGTMTTIVSQTFVLLFAVIDGVPVEKRVFEPAAVREEVRRLTGLLHMGRHGAVEART